MEQLNTYIQQARQQGQSDEQILQALVNAGWNSEQVNSALGITQNPATPSLMPQGTVIHGGFQSATSPYANQASSSQLNEPNHLSGSGQPPASPPGINKKSKMLLALVGGVIVLVLALGGTYAIFGRNANYKSVTCTSQNCFQQHFTTCTPATLNNANTTGVKYAINGPKGKGCSMTVEYAYNPNPAWKNQPMTCIFNNKENYESDVGQAFLDLSAKSNPDSCTGSLVKLMES
jgi:hypothetical protein